MKRYTEQLHNNIDGGLAHNMNPQDIADQHQVDISVILNQLEKGIQVEYEHTYNTEIAKEIAMDHLVEYPYYYDELEQMEKKFEYIRGNTMKRYERKFKEEDKDGNGIPDWLDDKISDVLEQLKDGNFGNAEGRQQFLDLITTLFNSKDKRARKSFKAISDLFSEIGDELIKYGQPEELEERKFKESLRSVEVTFADGSKLVTSMAAHLTDEDIKNYYKVGSSFNLGSGAKDKMVKVKSVKILK